jgi:serine/threonine protein kinase
LGEGVNRLMLVTRDGAPAGPPGGIALDPAFLERYEVGEAIGRGAMAMVLKARERSSGEDLAVKFLCRPNADQAKRLKLEGRLLLEIRHPSVLRVFETGEMGGHPYLVMELVTGGTLRDIITAKGKMSLAESIGMMADILTGLHACHEHGVVHRDLKPENILIDSSGRAKLADLGIAKSFGSQEEITKLGTLLGTPAYMAPEQIRGETVTVGTDIYSAGAMLYEMLAGRPPFVADALVALLAMHLNTPAPPITDHVEVPEALATALVAALSKRIDERPRSAEEFARRLRKCIASARPTPNLRGAGEASSSKLKLGDMVPERSGKLNQKDLVPERSGKLDKKDFEPPPSTAGLAGAGADMWAQRAAARPAAPAPAPAPPPTRDGSSGRVPRPVAEGSGARPRKRMSAPSRPPAPQKTKAQHLAETIGIGLLALALALAFVLLNADKPPPRRPPTTTSE